MKPHRIFPGARVNARQSVNALQSFLFLQMQQVEELVIVLDFHFMAVLGRTLGRFVSQFCGKRLTEVTVN